MDSKIVVYFPNANGSLFNIFDPIKKTWSGLGLNPPITSSPTTATHLQPSPANNDKSEIVASKFPLPAVIGGVLGALVLIVLVTFFVVRSRRRRQHQRSASKGARSYDRNSKTELLEDQQCLERMVSTVRSPQFNPAQPYNPSNTGKSLGRNPQSPVLEGVKFFPADLDFSSLPIRQHEHLQQKHPQHQPHPQSSTSSKKLQSTNSLGYSMQLSSSSLAPTLTDLSYQFNVSESDLLGRRADASTRFSSSTSLSANTTSSQTRHSQMSLDASNFDHMSEYIPTLMFHTPSPSHSPTPPNRHPSQTH